MYQHELSDREAYELFRRAIVERSDEAWSQIYAHYRPLLVAWSRQYHAHAPSAEPAEDLADRALARAWAALSPERFAQFTTLSALLAYLRTCVSATVIDQTRMETTRDRAYQKLELSTVATPEQVVVDSIARTAFWRLVGRMVETEAERIILVESFALALAPRQIQQRHPEHFASVAVVYSAKRNLLSRLTRCRDLRKLRDEWQA